MAVALVVGANLAQDLNPAGTTSSSFDTSGSNFLALGAAYFSGTPTITDAKGNAWNLLDSAGQFGVQAFIDSYYATVPVIVGSGETMTPTGNRGALAMAGFSGVHPTAPLDQHTATGGQSGVNASPGSISPTADSELVVCYIYFESGSVSSVSGMTIICQAVGASGICLAYVVQGTKTPVNPTITFSGSQTRSAAAIASFFQDPAGGGPVVDGDRKFTRQLDARRPGHMNFMGGSIMVNPRQGYNKKAA